MLVFALMANYPLKEYRYASLTNKSPAVTLSPDSSTNKFFGPDADTNFEERYEVRYPQR